MMKILFAGTGGAFAPMGKGEGEEFGTWHSNILVEKDGKYLAIDLGGDARHSIGQLGVKLADIEAAYISHTHGDHAYGFEWLFLMKYFTEIRQGKERPKLFGAQDVIERLWSQALSASLETIENFREANLTTFAEVHPFDPKNPKPFMWRGIEFTPVQTVHVMSGTKLQPSWGLVIQEKVRGAWPVSVAGNVDPRTPPSTLMQYELCEGNHLLGERGPHGRADLDRWTGTKVFLTTDTQFAPNQLRHFYGLADVIFHDCETSPFKSGVHAHFDDLCGLPVATRKKMRLYHYQPNPPHDKAKEAEFAGFVRTRQAFVFDGAGA